MFKPFRRFSHQLPFWAVASIAITGISLYSSKSLTYETVRPEVRKFDVGLSINVNRSSPAFAALEDTLENFEYSEDEVISPYAPISPLAAGETNFIASAEAIVADNLKVRHEAEQTQHLAEKKAEENLRRLQAFLENTFSKKSSQPLATATKSSTVTEALENLEPGSLIVSAGKIFKPSVKALTASSSKSVAFEPTTGATNAATSVKTISLAELKIDKKELLKTLLYPLVSAEKAARALPTHHAGVVPTRSYGNDEQRTNENARSAREDKQPSAMATQQSQKVEQDLRNITVVGNLDMLGGLAVTSANDEIVVYREVDGERLEAGYVWLRDGRYEIYIAENDGLLVSELYSNGFLIGRGEKDLAEVRTTTANASRIENVHLKLRPLSKGITGRVQSVYSHGPKIEPVAEAEVSVEGMDAAVIASGDGKFSNEEVVAGSVILLRAQRPNYWGTLAFAEAGEETPLTLFPNKMMEAFGSVLGARGSFSADRPPVIWGKVTRQGKAIAGAKVELLTGEEPLQPVYFNALMIPDSSLTSTSANGLYAFYPVEPGVQVLQVSVGSDALDPVIIPAEPGFVSTLDLEVSRQNRAIVKVFDAFHTHIPLAAEIRTLGNEETQMVGSTGQLELRTARNQGLIVFDADAGDEYAVTRVSTNGTKQSVLMPMVKQDWIDGLRSHRRITKVSEAGVAVGFVRTGNRFQVYASGSRPSAEVKIVYFDQNGKSLGSDFGVPGGGYVAYNLNEGLTTLSVVTERMHGVQVVTTLVEKDVVNVIQHTLK